MLGVHIVVFRRGLIGATLILDTGQLRVPIKIENVHMSKCF